MSDVQYTEFAKTQIKTPRLLSNDVNTTKVVTSEVDCTSETYGTDYYNNKQDISYVENNIIYFSNGSTKKHVFDFMNNSTRMFKGSTITSFLSDMSNLLNGTSMFQNCSTLRTFKGSLVRLNDAPDMFDGCKLDVESVYIIADLIKDNTGVSGNHRITIGIAASNEEEMIANDYVSHLRKIAAKNWTLIVKSSSGSTLSI